MYKYHDPSTVLSPQNRVDEVTTIFDGGINNGAFSIAKVIWEGQATIAIRWNLTDGEWDDQDKIAGNKICIGEPNSRGYATWFILPNPFLQAMLSGHGEIADGIRDALKEISK